VIDDLKKYEGWATGFIEVKNSIRKDLYSIFLQKYDDLKKEE
jgi:hypothetical protein